MVLPLLPETEITGIDRIDPFDQAGNHHRGGAARRGVSREIRAVKTFAAKTDKKITRFRLSRVRADTGNSRIGITVEHRPLNRLGNPARCRDERHSDFSSFSFAMRL